MSKIVLTGVKETLKALEQFDKDAVKEFTKVINSELRGAKKDAQSFVTADPPLSGWATQPARNPRSRGGAGWPAWDQSVIKGGIRSSKAERKVSKDYTIAHQIRPLGRCPAHRWRLGRLWQTGKGWPLCDYRR